MSSPRLALAVIGDEIGPSLSDMISFCKEHDVRRLDMRTVGGRSLLGMKIDEVNQIAQALSGAGIEVPTFVSPLLKWTLESRKSRTLPAKVDFAFDPDDCPAEDPISYAFDIAVVLGARKVRVFSYLRYRGFKNGHLESTASGLAGPAYLFDIPAELENEPVCNIGSVAEQARFFESLDDVEDTSGHLKHLRPLIDIANSWAMGAPPSDSDIASLAPRVDAIHLKDRDMAANRTVPLGDGDIPWQKALTDLLSKVRVPEVLASIETHCPADPRNATARSVAAARRIAREIGVEIV
jgi:sugar phosphate isomerase/epimerase